MKLIYIIENSCLKKRGKLVSWTVVLVERLARLFASKLHFK